MFGFESITTSGSIMKKLLIVFVSLFLYFHSLPAQKNKKNNQPTFSETWYDAIKWRPIGPYRGGRSCAVTGVSGKPNLYYFGSTGGGVWRTEDGGRHWESLSDGFFGGSVGAIAVSPSDHNVIYVGGGEKTVRGNVSHGYGIWKSVDAGKSWTQQGLEASRHIARIRIHPQQPDWVYAAVMGNLYKPHPQRGVFRSKDGGQNWEKILFVNQEVGAVDLVMDPNNPRILYASTWRIRRTPHSLSSGGQGCGIWKSTDSGDTWEALTANKGLPTDTLGIIGLAVSPVNSERVWAIIESNTGGVFRSEDAGKSWKKLNDERSLRQRAWYYTRIYADPKDADVVYVMNVSYHKSKDGGKTFSKHYAPHGDHHDLWIAPENPQRMIIGDDGGAQITYDGGATWTTYHNQNTAQFYRVTTDHRFPYRIYAAQQDNSTIRIQHRSDSWSITEKHWESTAGCECGHIAIDPRNADIVYGGCYDGYLQRLDHGTQMSRNISVWPDNPMGHGAEGMRYRFQWNFPLFFSPHDPKKLYAASNHLHLSTDEGHSWQIISPDLTRNDSSKLVPSGGPITKDNTSVEYYCTIFASAESPREEGLLWAGSDDGLLHLSTDGGASWQNVTPASLPEWSQINSIEPDPFRDGGLYVAATRYKQGDFRPLLFHTTDYGKSWRKITKGIDNQHFTRVIRSDPKRKGLLYAGTESGIYISWDDGIHWQSFQLNLPIVPITDLAVKEDNLIAATQGRGIWLIDDLTPLRQLEPQLSKKAFHLFQPKVSYRKKGGQAKKPKNAGLNHPAGLIVYYYIKELDDSTKVRLRFETKDSLVIREFVRGAKEKENQLEVKEGSNVFVWNLNYPTAEKFEGMVLWWANLNGPAVVPGIYRIVLSVDGQEVSKQAVIKKDPRSPTSQSGYLAQFDFIRSINEKISEAHQCIKDIRDVRAQLEHYRKRLKGLDEKKPLLEMAAQIDSSMTVVEEALYQTKNRSSQDPLNFPIRLTNKLAHLNSINRGDYPPTEQSLAVRDELVAAIDVELGKWQTIRQWDIPNFNQHMRRMAVDAIILREAEDGER